MTIYANGVERSEAWLRENGGEVVKLRVHNCPALVKKGEKN